MAAGGLSRVGASVGCSLAELLGLLPAEVSPAAEHRLRGPAQSLWGTGAGASQRMSSSLSGAGTQVPCTGRWVLNHWPNWEALDLNPFQCSIDRPNYLPFWPVRTSVELKFDSD